MVILRTAILIAALLIASVIPNHPPIGDLMARIVAWALVVGLVMDLAEFYKRMVRK